MLLIVSQLDFFWTLPVGETLHLKFFDKRTDPILKPNLKFFMIKKYRSYFKTDKVLLKIEWTEVLQLFLFKKHFCFKSPWMDKQQFAPGMYVHVHQYCQLWLLHHIQDSWIYICDWWSYKVVQQWCLCWSWSPLYTLDRLGLCFCRFHKLKERYCI